MALSSMIASASNASISNSNAAQSNLEASKNTLYKAPQVYFWLLLCGACCIMHGICIELAKGLARGLLFLNSYCCGMQRFLCDLEVFPNSIHESFVTGSN